MNIIKQNPFRVLGLTGNATEKELQKQIGIIKRYAEVGKTKSFDYDFEFIGEFTRTPDDVQEASNKIEQAHKKLLYSLFWFVKNTQFDEIAFNNLRENETEKAIEIWNKTLKEEITTKNYSSYLNLSTLYIALSTFADKIDFEKLQTGISLKGNLIHSENFKDFSKLVTGNGVANEPIEISKKFVDELIELLKPYINKNNGISTNDLISLFDSFPPTIQKYISSKFTEVPVSNIENNIEKTSRKRKDNPRYAKEYGEELYKSTNQDISLLKKLIGSSSLQLQMLADKVANEILQCSIDFFNERQKTDSDDDFEKNLNSAMKVVKLADSVAMGEQVKDKVKENINTLWEMKDREISQAINLLRSVKEAYESNETKIRRQVRIQKASLDYGQSINWSKVNELIRNSIDWDKVTDLILKTIPSKNIEKIRNVQNDSKIEEYKRLVEFVLDKINHSNERKIKYLCYWKTSKNNVSNKRAAHTSSSSNYSRPSSYSSDENDLSYLPWVIGIAAGVIGGLLGGGGGFFIGAFIGAIIGNIIKNT